MIEDLVQYAFGYGFAGLFAILFWKYIQDVQMKQVEKLESLENHLTRIEDNQYRFEREFENDRE